MTMLNFGETTNRSIKTEFVRYDNSLRRCIAHTLFGLPPLSPLQVETNIIIEADIVSNFIRTVEQHPLIFFPGFYGILEDSEITAKLSTGRTGKTVTITIDGISVDAINAFRSSYFYTRLYNHIKIGLYVDGGGVGCIALSILSEDGTFPITIPKFNDEDVVDIKIGECRIWCNRNDGCPKITLIPLDIVHWIKKMIESKKNEPVDDVFVSKIKSDFNAAVSGIREHSLIRVDREIENLVSHIEELEANLGQARKDIKKLHELRDLISNTTIL